MAALDGQVQEIKECFHGCIPPDQPVGSYSGRKFLTERYRLCFAQPSGVRYRQCQ